MTKGRVAHPSTVALCCNEDWLLLNYGFCFQAILIKSCFGIAFHGLHVEMLHKLPFVTTKGFHIKANEVNHPCDPCECQRPSQITKTVLYWKKGAV